VEVENATTVLFSIEGGYDPYVWSVSDTNLGEIVSSGDTAIYTPAEETGENTVTVTDDDESSVSATVTQI
jgi:hypothetical protein